MKHVGLNVAADPLFTISYQGVEAGLVICVADDPGMFSSQNEQDSRHYAIAAKIPMLEPADSAGGPGLSPSEAFQPLGGIPIPPSFCGCVTRISHSQSMVEVGTSGRNGPRESTYVKDTAKRVMMTRQLPESPATRGGGAHPRR